MKGYHVSYYNVLDSILEKGLIPNDTTQNNFPGALRHEGEFRLFFMKSKKACAYWYKVHHPADYSWGENRIIEEMDRGISIVLEFYIPQYIPVFPDPYQFEGEMMEFSYYTTDSIEPCHIVEIYDAKSFSRELGPI